MSVFNSKNKNGEKFYYVSSFSGIENFPKKMSLRLILGKDRFDIKTVSSNKEFRYLNYSQIKDVGIVTEKEIQEADKSVVGRAVVGGLLLGPLGAVVGGVSGVGKKQKTNHNIYLVINYISSDSSEPKVLTFLCDAINFGINTNKFVDELREKSGLQPVEKKKINHNL